MGTTTAGDFDWRALFTAGHLGELSFIRSGREVPAVNAGSELVIGRFWQGGQAAVRNSAGDSRCIGD
jgi:hypothetical protein